MNFKIAIKDKVLDMFTGQLYDGLELNETDALLVLDGLAHRAQKVKRHREDDGGVLLGSDTGQGLQVAQLESRPSIEQYILVIRDHNEKRNPNMINKGY